MARITHVIPSLRLALSGVKLDESGAVMRASVVNGLWTLERKNDEWLSKSDDRILNRWPVKPEDSNVVGVPDAMDGDYNEVIEWAISQSVQPLPLEFDPALVKIERTRLSTTQGGFTVFYNNRLVSHFHDPIAMTGRKNSLGQMIWEGRSDEQIIETARRIYAEGHPKADIPPTRLFDALDRIGAGKTVILDDESFDAMVSLDECPTNIISIANPLRVGTKDAWMVGTKEAIAAAAPGVYERLRIKNDLLAQQLSAAGASNPLFWAEQMRWLAAALTKLADIQEEQGGELSETQDDAKHELRDAIRQVMGDLPGVKEVEFSNDPRFATVILQLANGRANRMSGGWAVDVDMDRFDGLFLKNFWEDLPRFFKEIGVNLDAKPEVMEVQKKSASKGMEP